MDQDRFFYNDVLRICGVKLNRLYWWIASGWISPSIEKASGAGTKNIFSRRDLYRIALFKLLTESGVQRESASTALQIEEALWAADASRVWLIVDRRNKIVVGHLPDAHHAGREGNTPSGMVLQKTIAKRFTAGAVDLLLVDFGKIKQSVDDRL